MENQEHESTEPISHNTTKIDLICYILFEHSTQEAVVN